MSLFEECMCIVEGTQFEGESEIASVMEAFFKKKKKDTTTPASRKSGYDKALKAANKWISENKSRHKGSITTKETDKEAREEQKDQYDKFVSMQDTFAYLYHYDAWKHSSNARSEEAGVEFGKLLDELDKYIEDVVGDDFKVVSLGDWDGGSMGLAVHGHR